MAKKIGSEMLKVSADGSGDVLAWLKVMEVMASSRKSQCGNFLSLFLERDVLVL